MHCYIIRTGDEVIEGAKEFASLGYTFEDFPSVQNPDEITSLVKDVDSPAVHFHPKPLQDYTARKHAKSLKATFIKLLSSIETDKVLFCESDCIPGIDADKLLEALEQDETYGLVLRAKGMVPSEGGTWIYFDYVPGESDVREGKPDVTGKICVIGSNLNEENLKKLFERN